MSAKSPLSLSTTIKPLLSFLKTHLLFIIPALVYLLAAIFSNGYHHPDEHYQLIEFAGLQAGWNQPADLPWEYSAQIRPTLQPSIAFIIFSIFNFLGVRDPFHLATILRLITAVFALFSINFFIKSFLPLIKKHLHTAFILISYLLWFLPNINVRFSSETWAGLCFLFAIALIQRHNKSPRTSSSAPLAKNSRTNPFNSAPNNTRIKSASALNATRIKPNQKNSPKNPNTKPAQIKPNIFSIRPSTSLISPRPTPNLSINTSLLLGILLALSFEFRFQMALPILGLLLWLIFIHKVTFKQFFSIGLGSLIIISLCTLLDSFFYGNFVFTLYNYFQYNIIYDVASAFGTSPWYTYFFQILQNPTLPLGILIITSIIILLITAPKNILLWCLLPFVIIQSLIPHKELRFLFPLANFIPIIIILAYQSIEKYLFRFSVTTFLVKFFALILLAINLIGLLMIFKPASDGGIDLIQYLHKKSQQTNQTLLIYTPIYNNPYTIGDVPGLTANFYVRENIVLRDISDFFSNPQSEQLIIIPKEYHQECQLIESFGYQIEKESISDWLKAINRLYRVYDEETAFLLYSQ